MNHSFGRPLHTVWTYGGMGVWKKNTSIPKFCCRIWSRVAFQALALALIWMMSIPPDASAQDGPDDPNTIFEPALFQGMDFRMIGPSRGGRVTAVAGHRAQPHTFYMGATGGGVWKTTDYGATWRSISDGYFKTASIGAIDVADSDPNVLYVGTGSDGIRSNVIVGRGLYKSTDAGKTWTFLGLRDTGQIGAVVVHPTNPDVVYVAALGNPFGPNPERGVYKTIDGGATWEHALFVSEQTGAVDLELNPADPDEVYAALWRAERKPWTIISGDDSEDGLYKSTDGGKTWTKVENGLPQGLIGKIDLAVSPADPSRVYALVEAVPEEEGLYRSNDRGDSWRLVSTQRGLMNRPFYYTNVDADPTDADVVYVNNEGFYKSTDAGKSFRRVATPHGDNHDMWINPDHPEIFVQSNDGGANVTLNGGRTWSTQANQPTAELYQIHVDDRFPYWVYAGQQDNSTIAVPSLPPVRLPGGPTAYWEAIGGCETGPAVPRPGDANIVYSNCKGRFGRYNRTTGQEQQYYVGAVNMYGRNPSELPYRFQRVVPIEVSPHNPDVLYHTSQYVHRTTDGGQTWETISPDLTTNNDAYQDIPGGPIQHDHTGVELYTTIFAFEESPHAAGELWVGTDDGRVHLSRDNGATWQEITPPDMPEEGTVNTIDLSAHAPGRAFVAVYKYREADFRPYLFRTDDYGQSWDRLTDGDNGIPDDHFVRVVREDPDRRGLLYAGTEFGLYVSFDDGAHWQSLQLNLPVTPITDMVVHEQDLVVATQGRSFWILDDLTPLHQLTDAVAGAAMHLFAPRPAYRTQLRGFGGPNAPESRPNGAVIYFNFAEKPDTAATVTLEILDEDNAVVRTFSTKPDEDKNEGTLAVKKGMNRFVWDLNYPAPDLVEGAVMSLAYTGGPKAATGDYSVRLTSGEHTQTQAFAVKKDPRWPYSDEDLQVQFDLTMAVLATLNETHAAIRTIRSVREQTKALADRAVKAGHTETLKTAARELGEKLTALEDKLIQTRSESSQDPINYPSMIDDQIAYLYTVVNFQDARPTAGSYERFDDLKAELQPHLDALQSILSTDLAAFNALLEQEGVSHIVVPSK